MYNVLITDLPGEMRGILYTMIIKQVDKEHYNNVDNYV